MFLCSKCPKYFTDQMKVKVHQRYNLGEHYNCIVCKKTFSSKPSFVAHYAQHKEEVYSCEECFKTFKHKASLVAHNRLHNGKFKCIYCYKNFHKKDRLTTHLISCDKDVIDELQSFETNTTVTIKSSLTNNNFLNNNGNIDEVSYSMTDAGTPTEEKLLENETFNYVKNSCTCLQ